MLLKLLQTRLQQFECFISSARGSFQVPGQSCTIQLPLLN
jgi:hypothetical protein